MTVSNSDPGSFSKNLESIENAMVNSKGKIRINDRLEVVKKENGFLFFLKVIVLPVARMFGQDPFLHTRAHRVATELLNQYNTHKDSLDEDGIKRLGKIINLLNKNTKGRYAKKIKPLFSMLPNVKFEEPTTTPGTPGATNPPPPPPPSKQPTTTSTAKPTAARANLLADIRNGKKLKASKKDEEGSTDEVESKKPSAAPNGGLFAALLNSPMAKAPSNPTTGTPADELNALFQKDQRPLKKAPQTKEQQPDAIDSPNAAKTTARPLPAVPQTAKPKPLVKPNADTSFASPQDELKAKLNGSQGLLKKPTSRPLPSPVKTSTVTDDKQGDTGVDTRQIDAFAAFGLKPKKQ